jgi:hypothetical protein
MQVPKRKPQLTLQQGVAILAVVLTTSASLKLPAGRQKRTDGPPVLSVRIFAISATSDAFSSRKSRACFALSTRPLLVVACVAACGRSRGANRARELLRARAKT